MYSAIRNPKNQPTEITCRKELALFMLVACLAFVPAARSASSTQRHLEMGSYCMGLFEPGDSSVWLYPADLSKSENPGGGGQGLTVHYLGSVEGWPADVSFTLLQNGDAVFSKESLYGVGPELQGVIGGDLGYLTFTGTFWFIDGQNLEKSTQFSLKPVPTAAECFGPMPSEVFAAIGSAWHRPHSADQATVKQAPSPHMQQTLQALFSNKAVAARVAGASKAATPGRSAQLPAASSLSAPKGALGSGVPSSSGEHAAPQRWQSLGQASQPAAASPSAPKGAWDNGVRSSAGEHSTPQRWQSLGQASQPAVANPSAPKGALGSGNPAPPSMHSKTETWQSPGQASQPGSPLAPEATLQRLGCTRGRDEFVCRSPEGLRECRVLLAEHKLPQIASCR